MHGMGGRQRGKGTWETRLETLIQKFMLEAFLKRPPRLNPPGRSSCLGLAMYLH